MGLLTLAGERKEWANKHNFSTAKISWNTPVEVLQKEAIDQHEGQLTEESLLVCKTGQFTGRSPSDKYIVKETSSEQHINWGKINQPIDERHFNALYEHMLQHLQHEAAKCYVRDSTVSADPMYKLNIRVVSTKAWGSIFAHYIFLRPSLEDLKHYTPHFTIYHAPDLQANPTEHGTNGETFIVINFERKIVLIGGTSFAGEIKKSIFTVLNYLLPIKHNVLTMHCAANTSENDNVALFFGLSGTGKTTLSAAYERKLIGDDEHAWSNNGIFNLEGGCYAKVARLNQIQEPQIWDAIYQGAMLENVQFFSGTKKINFYDTSLTENTRAVYPIEHIKGAITPSIGGHPSHIFFLTCDATGVLPPISKLNKQQAMYHFISGYTSKVGGTERGTAEQTTPTFSACFGDPFLPLHPIKYATMFGEKVAKYKVEVWLVNTGWSGLSNEEGGSRIPLEYTRTLVQAALEGKLLSVPYERLMHFQLMFPTACPEVSSEILNPEKNWQGKEEYHKAVTKLALSFIKNFQSYEKVADMEILLGGPHMPYYE